jgi:hypothetical protein
VHSTLCAFRSERRSNNATLAPHRAYRTAAVHPAMLAPLMMTSYVSASTISTSFCFVELFVEPRTDRRRRGQESDARRDGHWSHQEPPARSNTLSDSDDNGPRLTS